MQTNQQSKPEHTQDQTDNQAVENAQAHSVGANPDFVSSSEVIGAQEDNRIKELNGVAQNQHAEDAQKASDIMVDTADQHNQPVESGIGDRFDIKGEPPIDTGSSDSHESRRLARYDKTHFNTNIEPVGDGAKKTNEQGEYVQVHKENYKSYVFEKSPKSAHFKNTILAFIIGGLICVVGQLLIEGFILLNFEKETASVLASSTLVALAAIATGLGIYDCLGRFAGAGSTIPITGFSNAIVAPAIEFRSEGLVYGLGAKMFLVAGPVIVNGVAAAVIIALLTMIFM